MGDAVELAEVCERLPELGSSIDLIFLGQLNSSNQVTSCVSVLSVVACPIFAVQA